MQLFFGIGYFVIGLIQLFAVVDGIGYALDIGGVVSFILAIIVTYIPVIGSIIGVYGAVNVWDWSIWQAAALFFWYIPAIILLTIFSAVTDR